MSMYSAETKALTRHPLVVLAVGLGAFVGGCFSAGEYDTSGDVVTPEGESADGTTTTGATGATGATGTTGATATSTSGAGTTTGTGGAGTTTTGVADGTTTVSGATSTSGGGTSASGTGGAAVVGDGGATSGMGGASTTGASTDGAVTVPTYMCDDVKITCDGQADGKDCLGINQLAYVPSDGFPGGDGNDIWGWTDPDTGKEYALMGLNGGTAFIDISDPCRPVHLGSLRTQTQNALWRDIKTYQNYAYIVAESSGHGLQVFDLTQLRDVANPPAVFEATNVVETFGSSHNLALNPDTGFAYVLAMDNCADGRSFDLSDPLNPVDLGCWGSGSRTHDAMCFVYNGPDAANAGKEICITGSEGRGMWIYDMTDKGNVSVISQQTTYPSMSYAHQVWVTEDHHYVYMCDEADEIDFGINMTINIFDLSNLAAPAHVGQYVSDLPHADHNIFVRGNYAFLAAYAGGLRVLDISDPTVPVEVGYFDTYPENNNANFDGQWGVYPYFKSGVLITNGIIKGLHILEPDFSWMQDSQWIGW